MKAKLGKLGPILLLETGIEGWSCEGKAALSRQHYPVGGCLKSDLNENLKDFSVYR